MNILRHTKIFLSVAAVLVVASWVAIAVFGLRPGIDLRGGTEWWISFDEPVTREAVEAYLQNEIASEAVVKVVGDDSYILRLPDITEVEHQTYKTNLTEEFGSFEERSFSTVGPVIGAELRQKSLWAIVGVLLGISLYTAWAFRKVSEPISSWKYGIVTLGTLVHDVSIPAGLFAILGWWHGIEVDTTFIVALLVVMGFSVHDTIVVFDRVRENLLHEHRKRRSLQEIINQSINETIVRSINTSVTLIVVLLALLFIGPPSLFYFILTILVGTIFGTYSSMFVASPTLYLWGKKHE